LKKASSTSPSPSLSRRRIERCDRQRIHLDTGSHRALGPRAGAARCHAAIEHAVAAGNSPESRSRQLPLLRAGPGSGGADRHREVHAATLCATTALEPSRRSKGASTLGDPGLVRGCFETRELASGPVGSSARSQLRDIALGRSRTRASVGRSGEGARVRPLQAFAHGNHGARLPVMTTAVTSASHERRIALILSEEGPRSLRGRRSLVHLRRPYSDPRPTPPVDILSGTSVGPSTLLPGRALE